MKLYNLCCKILAFAIILVVFESTEAKLEERFSWKQVAFNWPSKRAEQEAIQSGQYIPANNLPLGVERWQNKLFVTVPRWKIGVAATLNYIDLNTLEQSPKLKPYPSWTANTLSTSRVARQSQQNKTVSRFNNRVQRQSQTPPIVSVVRVQADACNRLWMVDTGTNNITGIRQQLQPYAILIFDLRTDQLLRRYEIPSEQIRQATLVVNIAVDCEQNACADAYAYIPDLYGYGLFVYSFRENRSYRINHNFFHMEPMSGDLTVGGINFQWNDGIISLALVPQADNSKNVYFHAMASTKEFMVSNRVLKNETYVTSRSAFHEFQFVGDRGVNGQSTVGVYDKELGVVYYTQLMKNAVACWNVNDPYTPETQGVVESNAETLEFPNDIKVDVDGNVWILSNKIQRFIYSTMDPNVTNYRIFVGKNRDLIEGTPCTAKA